MDNVKILILSLVQGITELLPISSSAHLILTGKLLNWDISSNTLLLAVLHIGTTLAIILFFRKELFKGFFTKKKWTFFLKLLIASLPTAIIGLLFEDKISHFLRGNLIMAISLIVVGILFIIAENIKIPSHDTDPENIPLWKMILIGIGQVLSLIPGVSRSGITILTGIALGLEKYTSFSLSFMLGIPLLIGSNFYIIAKAYMLSDSINVTTASLSFVKMLPIILVTFIVGYIALLVVKKFKKGKWLTIFGVYRILLGIFILIFAI